MGDEGAETVRSLFFQRRATAVRAASTQASCHGGTLSSAHLLEIGGLAECSSVLGIVCARRHRRLYACWRCSCRWLEPGLCPAPHARRLQAERQGRAGAGNAAAARGTLVDRREVACRELGGRYGAAAGCRRASLARLSSLWTDVLGLPRLLGGRLQFRYGPRALSQGGCHPVVHRSARRSACSAAAAAGAAMAAAAAVEAAAVLAAAAAPAAYGLRTLRSSTATRCAAWLGNAVLLPVRAATPATQPQLACALVTRTTQYDTHDACIKLCSGRPLPRSPHVRSYPPRR